MLDIDYRSGTPIYKQIVEGLKEKILIGTLEADSKIPSIRALAGELRINPNTIKKAYLILEQEGYTYSIKGRGSFVKPLKEQQIEVQRLEIEKALSEIVDKAKRINLGEEALNAIIKGMYEEVK